MRVVFLEKSGRLGVPAKRRFHVELIWQFDVSMCGVEGRHVVLQPARVDRGIPGHDGEQHLVFAKSRG